METGWCHHCCAPISQPDGFKRFIWLALDKFDVVVLKHKSRWFCHLMADGALGMLAGNCLCDDKSDLA